MQKQSLSSSNSFKIIILVSFFSITVFIIILPNTFAQTTSSTDESYYLIKQMGSNGTENSQFQGPSGIAVDSANNVYVADNGNYQIQKFDSNGKFITKWGIFVTFTGQFFNPSDIAVDSSNNIYVADNGNDGVKVFAPIKQNQMSNIKSSNGYPNLNTTSSMHTPIGIDNKNITLMINNQTTSNILQNKHLSQQKI
jgi:hypothetical protein